ncbi:eukaryotic translation elongation factor 1 epsilon-1-like [Macrobrachium nipponense]|uniref:eukaryotic translation elongation factor 1 epsilon-1-like n=1 Tax=Macrobrachium nipponense TaxID=159736 RepID=UPI0030C8C997
MEKKIVSDFAKYLGAGKVKVASEKNGVVVEVGGKKFSGFVCGVLNLIRLQKQSLEGSTVLQRCLTHDWLTQCATDLFHCSTYEELNSNLHYIDKELLTRTYLCGHMVTAADIIMFLILYPFVAKWTYQQKEQYLNISRWFSAVQNDANLKKSHKPVQFSRTCLYEGSARCH